jgi:threonyl-tRNA synthetase
MEEVVLTLPDESTLKVPAGTTGMEATAQLGQRLAKDAVAYELDDELRDLSRPIERGGKFRVLTFADAKGKDVYRHSGAHLMAHAVVELFPEAQPTIGPVVDERFYYDFYSEHPFTPEDLQRIEERMHEIAKRDLPIEREECTVAEAHQRLGKYRNKFKEEILAEIPESETISLYRQGDFVDLCRGPHLPNTGRLKACKLLDVAGAYWRGDQKREQLQRIYGTAFPSKEGLKEYLERLEEAQRRDHRKLGRELELFMIHPSTPGALIWLPKGKILYDTLREAASEYHRREGYQEVFTPLMFKRDLFETSGHWEHFREDMFIISEDQTEYILKPMNCPSHMLIFGNRRRSYRELPLRIFDQGVLHRNEVTGALAGLTRVRQFCQDDSHIFLTEEMLTEEITRVIRMVRRVYEVFEMPTQVFLSTRPEKAMGEQALWDQAEAALKQAIEDNGLEYEILEGEGAFYGPKIDFLVRDALQREHQTATIQLDFHMPRRFGLTYIDANNTEQIPVVVHRAIYGSYERFIGVLIEHYGGVFPTWLAPVQCRVLPISDRWNEYGEKVRARLANAGSRVEIDTGNEKINAKIRDAETSKIPYMAVVGEREAGQETVAIRAHGGKDLGVISLSEFEARMVEEINAGGF